MVNCVHKIKLKEDTYLVYGGVRYCVRCAIAMINKFDCLPNDGGLRGGFLAMKLSTTKTVEKKCKLLT